ncbi:hypothetical protein JW824_05295 [bacterium]|nr:hypothetical protein [bacterium]
MDRKKFLKCACGFGISTCAGFGMFTNNILLADVTQNTQADEETPLVPVDTRQIQNVLSYIDSSMDESVKKNIFEKLGAEHITHEGFKNWIIESRKDLKGYFDRINSNKDTYWEKIEYDSDTSAIIITGKPVNRCACPYAQSENPPLALCHYCCVGFQKAMFEMLLEKPIIKVRIDESYLLGGSRCSSTMYIDGTLQI